VSERPPSSASLSWWGWRLVLQVGEGGKDVLDVHEQRCHLIALVRQYLCLWICACTHHSHAARPRPHASMPPYSNREAAERHQTQQPAGGQLRNIQRSSLSLEEKGY